MRGNLNIKFIYVPKSRLDELRLNKKFKEDEFTKSFRHIYRFGVVPFSINKKVYVDQYNITLFSKKITTNIHKCSFDLYRGVLDIFINEEVSKVLAKLNNPYN